MALVIGKRLGTFEITALIGVGGMGEVYRARDTKLGRDVAIKVLPPELASDPERVLRFEREARILAALDHPKIGALYDFQREGEVPFLVLQLVEGETLEDRLAHGVPCRSPRRSRSSLRSPRRWRRHTRRASFTAI